MALLRWYGSPGCFDSGLQVICIVGSGVSHLHLFCVRAVQVWHKEWFCSGGQNVRPLEKSFAQQEKKIEGTLLIGL